LKEKKKTIFSDDHIGEVKAAVTKSFIEVEDLDKAE
jgi:hypothetical protein